MRKGVIAATVLLLAATGCGDDPNGTPVGAKRACEAAINQQLKAPGDADYNLQTNATETGWLVTGYVDAPNSFGARLRSNISCETSGPNHNVDRAELR